MRICLVASSRYPIREPFAGGLESQTHGLAQELARRGHDVSLFAGAGSDQALSVQLLPALAFQPSRSAMADRNAPDRAWLAEHHAYLSLMLRLVHDTDRFDLVHNNSLHHLPVAMAPAVRAPMLTTLHTPPLPMMESALSLAPSGSVFTAVSAFTADAWAHVVPSTIVRNGVDVARWRRGGGGGPAVWSGRLVREKAPHDAIAACQRAGVPVVLAGPVHDRDYFDARIAPLLGDDVAYVGHLRHAELVDLLGTASVAVVTPAWDEPYGLVAAEAMSCGTPVAGYARGGLPEIVTRRAGVLVPAGDVDALAAAVLEARALPRCDVRRHAELECSLSRMVDDYERVYAGLLDGDVAA